MRERRRPTRAARKAMHGVACALLVGASLATAAVAEALQENPVYVDDSPQARELFQRAHEHVASNLTEATRSMQELLDEYALRLIPAQGAGNSFTTVRHRVLDVLRDPENAALLERYRAMERPRAQRMLEAGGPNDLERLVLTRPLTEPGLEAMLRLAQRHLEAARFRMAIDLLAEAVVHPDVASDSRRAAHAHFMLGVAGHYEGDNAALESAMHELALLGENHEALLDRLLQLEAAGTPRRPATGVSTFDRGRAGDLSGLVAEEIWSVDLTESPLARQAAMQGRRGPAPGIRGMPVPPQVSADDGRLATMVPTVAEFAGGAAMQGGSAGLPGVVYVSQGHTITALDRFTGNRIWERDYVDRATLLLADRMGEAIMDPNVIAVHGDSLVTITGHAHGSSRSSDGRVVCLSARTGDLRWAVRLDRLEIGRPSRPVATPENPFFGEEVEGLFPHGRPLILDDIVLLKARRISPQALTSAYLVALDLETGEARWVRHIASSGSIRRIARGFSAMVAYPEVGSHQSEVSGQKQEVHGLRQHAGDQHPTSDLRPLTSVYIVTAIGAVASVNPRTGEIQWLHRFSVPLQPMAQDINLRAWEVATPHITRDRVIASHPGRRQVAVYDRTTGELLALHDASGADGWSAPVYMLGDEQWLYAVTGSAGGRDIRAFRLDDLSRPAWRFPQQQQPLQIRGRVQLADVGLIVPTAHGVVILDRETGNVLVQLPIDASSGSTPAGPGELAGNAVAFDSQIILASDRRISAYMSLDRAERMLRDRMVAAPNNPEPALSLARLALRARDLELALEAGKLALAAIDSDRPDRTAPHRSVTPRDRLVSLLLELNAHDVPQTPEQVDALFALVERAAWSPEQRLAHLLAYGDRMVDDDPVRAVAAWQRVLSDSDLAGVSRVESNVERPARGWAIMRLAQSIDRHGSGIYEPHAIDAQRSLNALKRGRAAADDFLALADEYPHAEAAVEALLAASTLLSEAGEHQRALAVLRAHDHTGGRSHARLSEAYASLAGELGLNARADAALRAAAQPQWPRLPRIGTPSGPAQVLNGRVLTPPSEGDHHAPADRLLLQDGRELAMLVASSAAGESGLTTQWTADLEAEAAPFSVIRWSERHLLVVVADEADPRVVALDPELGAVRWRTPRFASVFGSPRQPEMRMTPMGERIDPNAVLAAADDESLLLVQRSGNIAAFDVRAGGKPLWQSGPQLSNDARVNSAPVVPAASLDEIHFVHLRGGVLALGGSARRSPGRTAAAVAVLDTRTGMSILPQFIRLDADPLWMELSDRGRVLYGGAEGIGCIDVWRGGHAWVNIAPEAVDARRAWLGSADGEDERLYFEDAQLNLRMVDARSGSIAARFEPPRDAGPAQPQQLIAPQLRPPQPANELLALQPLERGEALGHYRQRIVRYSSEGDIIGADVLSGERSFTWLLRGRAIEEAEVTGQHSDVGGQSSEVNGEESEVGGQQSAVDGQPPDDERRAGDMAADRLILINALPPVAGPVPGAAVGARRTQHRHHVYVLSGNARLLGEPIELPPLPEPIRHASLIDGWLVLSLTERAIAVPMR